MDNRSEVRSFLTSRRARLSPEQAGLASHGHRRVAGLRRGEVAALAGVSVEYYTRLERGNLSGVSESVLNALALALRLDDTERSYLETLARAATSGLARSSRRRSDSAVKIRPAVLRVLESMQGVPAFLRNHRFDILVANPLGRALYAPMFDAAPVPPVNSMRFAFLTPGAQAFYADWSTVARESVGALRIAATRNPHDQELMNLIGELSMRSATFGTLWAGQDVFVHRHGTKRFVHPAVGRLDLDHEALELPGEDGLTVITYSAEAGSPAGDGLELLATWAADTLATREG